MTLTACDCSAATLTHNAEQRRCVIPQARRAISLSAVRSRSDRRNAPRWPSRSLRAKPSRSRCAKPSIWLGAIDAQLDARRFTEWRSSLKGSVPKTRQLLREIPVCPLVLTPTAPAGQFEGEAALGRVLLRKRTTNLCGAPGRIRTCGLWLRRPTLYPAELRAPNED